MSENPNMPNDSIPTNSNGAARWRICLHEAGHAVAGRVLLGQSTKAIVFDDTYGVAYVGNQEVISTNEEALTIAAGKAAEALIGTCPPPGFAPAPPLATTYRESATALLEEIKTTAVSDAVKLAHWSILYCENRPHRWARNYYHLMDRADEFVKEHKEEIVKVATGLFAQGIVTLPAKPEEGMANAD